MTILIRSSGRMLTMRTVSPPLMVFELVAGSPYPLPLHDTLMCEEDARLLARNLLASPDYYTRTV